ncbi:rod shape-determining protein MreD [Thermomicrobium sp. 4228-Ro]|uniref:rod shape-determining protein MreD n=1 Tax=Thermomicrobium sp. 4228-Ro TaxID=2993937 RepID=UPI00224924D3|nr:rod shape-determining protein MreD [Thermomicrobium sp. 4228-Ro]MCX2727268.1 rod shape-determining protein MreD [Thermomicrobium sp. 4228-Ro]
MRQLVIAIFLLSAAALEVLVLPRSAPYGLFPDLVLGVVLVASAVEGLRTGLLWAALGGLSLDLLAAHPWGAHVLALLPAAAVGAAARRGMYRSAVLPLMGFVGLVTVLYRVLLTLVRWPSEADVWVDAAITAILVGLLNMMTVPLVYGVIALFGRVGVGRARAN